MDGDTGLCDSDTDLEVAKAIATLYPNGNVCIKATWHEYNESERKSDADYSERVLSEPPRSSSCIFVNFLRKTMTYSQN